MQFKNRICEYCKEQNSTTAVRKIDEKTKMLLCEKCYWDFIQNKIKLKEFDFTGDRNE